jgi:hypothetical protein
MRCASLLETVTDKSATLVLLAATKGRRTMKYICLSYYDKSKHDTMTAAEKQAVFDACFTYDDHLRDCSLGRSRAIICPRARKRP